MPTLKEIKGRIGSVKNTLKITSAMKLVSSAKLRKVQAATESLREYEKALQGILAELGRYDKGAPVTPDTKRESLPRAIVAMASNSSLCGGFNANIIAKVRSIRQNGDRVYSIGRKMADAMRRDGYPSPEDFTSLSEHPSYAPAAKLAEQLMKDVEDGLLGQVLLVYTHFVSTSRQVPVVEILSGEILPATNQESDVIIEPNRAELLKELLPKALKLKLYAALLDSAASEHAARTIAMQTATDNGNDLLDELTLQYNKGRQQKITNEILDLAGGALQ